MEDLWRVRQSSIDLHDIADLAEYHRFLNRFNEQEQTRHMNDLLYGDARFGTAPVPHEDIG